MSRTIRKIGVLMVALIGMFLASTGVANATPNYQGGAIAQAGVAQYGVTNVTSVSTMFAEPAVRTPRTAVIIESVMNWTSSGEVLKAGAQFNYDASGNKTVRLYVYATDGGGLRLSSPVTFSATAGKRLDVSVFFNIESATATAQLTYVTGTGSDIRYHLLARKVINITDSGFSGAVRPSWQIEKAQNAASVFLPFPNTTFVLKGVYGTGTTANQPITTGGNSQAYNATPDGNFYGNNCNNQNNRAVVVPSSVSSDPGDSSFTVKVCPSGTRSEMVPTDWTWKGSAPLNKSELALAS